MLLLLLFCLFYKLHGAFGILFELIHTYTAGTLNALQGEGCI